ncbi:MAG: folylpolyglutamate synthase/dihydrofolate synthase family protein [Bacilli bacterium]
MFNNAKDLIAWIEMQKRHSPKVSMEKMRKLSAVYGNPHEGIKYIHIGGTNGKGSTVSFVKGILRSAGFNVGSYVSPYVISFNERISYNDQFISDEDLLAIGNFLLSRYPIIEQLEIELPTFFEFVTLMAYVYFSRIKDLDFVTLEVGLGGRLDATNIVTPLVSVITNVHYDHMNVLGDTLEEIAFNKLGIVKPKIPLITIKNDQLLAQFKETTKERGSDLILVDKKDIKNIEITLDYTSFDYLELSNVKLRLLGYYQTENASLAIRVAKLLRDRYQIAITDKHILTGLWETFWPGRLQVVSKDPVILIDGAHNLDGITRLTEFLKAIKGKNYLKIVFAVSADKAKEKMIPLIDEVADEIIFTRYSYKRSDEAEHLLDYSHHPNKRVEENLDKIIAEVKQDKDKLIVFCGSLYFVADLIKIFG